MRLCADWFGENIIKNTVFAPITGMKYTDTSERGETDYLVVMISGETCCLSREEIYNTDK